MDRIDCANTAAAPRTDSYPGCGAHPIGFDPQIVINCEGWDSDTAEYVAPADAEAHLRPALTEAEEMMRASLIRQPRRYMAALYLRAEIAETLARFGGGR